MGPPARLGFFVGFRTLCVDPKENSNAVRIVLWLATLRPTSNTPAAVAEASVVYIDRGIGKCMEYGIASAHAAGLPIEMQSIESAEPVNATG